MTSADYNILEDGVNASTTSSQRHGWVKTILAAGGVAALMLMCVSNYGTQMISLSTPTSISLGWNPNPCIDFCKNSGVCDAQGGLDHDVIDV